jgi:predicted acyl esterase
MSLASTLRAGLLAAAALTAFAATPLNAQTPALTPDIDGKYVAPKAGYDYDKRVVMVPMRDGTKLYTVIVVPKGAKNAPILLTRTPYNAAKRAKRH